MGCGKAARDTDGMLLQCTGEWVDMAVEWEESEVGKRGLEVGVGGGGRELKVTRVCVCKEGMHYVQKPNQNRPAKLIVTSLLSPPPARKKKKKEKKEKKKFVGFATVLLSVSVLRAASEFIHIFASLF